MSSARMRSLGQRMAASPEATVAYSVGCREGLLCREREIHHGFRGHELPRHPGRCGRGFAWGAAYYMTLSKQWLAAVGRTEPNKSPTPFILSFVALLVMAFVLSGASAHLGPGQVTVKNGIISG